MTSTTAHIPFSQRSSKHPLSAYLFRLMLVKSSNLCLSADVTSASALLSLANSIGPSIVILKTHFDIVADWDSHPTRGTGACLAALARRHGFLIFEDRKFSDIGSTVQKQYTSGPGAIVEWAHITNAHILPGKAIVEALGDAANLWKQKKRFAVRTRISVGTPRPESFVSEADGTQTPMSNGNDDATDVAVRKASIVSMTTISQHFEDANAAPTRSEATDEEEEGPFVAIEEAPLDRGLLLLAQMSSAGNFLDAAYTKACVDIARSNKDFVMGYIAQESLNTEPQDQFLTMTPGCQLPPGDYGEVDGDGKGQQYNTPQRLVGTFGCDVIIVGRGIINAADPLAEAERYRSKAWKAYEERVAKDDISEAAKS